MSTAVDCTQPPIYTVSRIAVLAYTTPARGQVKSGLARLRLLPRLYFTVLHYTAP